jgi:thermitase
MRRHDCPPRRRAHPSLIVLLAASFFLTGCEVLFRPQLHVSPQVLEFPVQTATLAVQVTNTGADGSLLRWEASGASRLTISPTHGTLRAGETEAVWITVNRAGLTESSLITAQIAGARAVAEVTAIVDPPAPVTPAACDPDPAIRYAGVEPWPLEAAAAAFAAAGVLPTGVHVRWRTPTDVALPLDVRGVAERLPSAAVALVARIVPHDGGAWLSSADPLALARRLVGDPAVRWVELDGPIVRPTVGSAALPDDPSYVGGEQWYLDAFGFAPGRVVASSVVADDVVVAVIDTGLRTSHEEHVDRAVAGRSFLGDASTTTVDDTDGHGTHVAGLIAAAEGNGVGIVGLGAHAGVRVQPIKVFNATGQATIADLVRAIRWAAGMSVKVDGSRVTVPPNEVRVDVVNLSLGSALPSSELRLAVIDARCEGVVLVAASGNGGANGGVDYPAAYPEVISVGSVDQNMRRSSFSDYGEGLIDLMAPGGSPLSGSRGCGGLLSTYATADDAYTCLAGTSMATPLVAASAAALIASAPSTYRGDPPAVETALRAAAGLRPGSSRAEYGYGVLCLDALLTTTSVCGEPRGD